ncbi:MAG: hydrogenase nickel incorporation protein HypB [Spirochaetales bacterium]|nr:hydrogenase nickel incorporation protein HypB [Spirochaetales bacterium]
MSSETVKVYRDLMGHNAEWAEKTRKLCAENGITLFNIIGSPGCGKTALLEKIIPIIREKHRCAVLEGDIETTNDADRLAALHIPVSQLLTSGICHLEAKLVHHALRDLPLRDIDYVIVENVGNLVCPAEFDIGEHAKIVVLSVTEGEDKPIKYPLVFRESKAIILTKTDLLPHVPFRLQDCMDYIKKVNFGSPVFHISALRGDGLTALVDWISGYPGIHTQTKTD